MVNENGVEDQTVPVNAALSDYAIHTDPDRLDLDVIHGFLARSYWSPGI